MRQTTQFLLAAFLAAAPAAAQGSRFAQSGTGQYSSSSMPLTGDGPVSLTVTPPSGTIRMADSFKFNVEASLPENYSLKPDTAAGGSEFELLSFTKTGETKKDGERSAWNGHRARKFAPLRSSFTY